MTEGERKRWPYKMKDLCERTGLLRQAIHFYIQQGLLPEGHKPGRNMAYYGEEHIERLQLIRKLQQERFLPLKVIRALLSDRDELFTEQQRQQLARLRKTLTPVLGVTTKETIPVLDLLSTLGMSEEDLAELVQASVICTATDAEGRQIIARDDIWILEMVAALRRAGFTKDLGFRGSDFALYDEVVRGLLAKEAQVVARCMSSLPAEQSAAMLERGLPIIHEFIARLHTARVRSFLETL